MHWIDGTDRNQAGKTRSLVCDFASDLAYLPTSSAEGTGGENDTANEKVAKGSTCLCIEESAIYILNSEDTWVQI